MPTWPVTLPQKFLQDSFEDTEPDLVVIEQMDSGPPIIRRKCTAAARPFGGAMWFTPAQKVILRAWYRTYCATPFDFPDPDLETPISVVFKAAPVYGDVHGLYQKVTLKLAEMP